MAQREVDHQHDAEGIPDADHDADTLWDYRGLFWRRPNLAAILTVALLSLELLPDWYDEWVVSEADTWKHLRRNALEAQTEHLVRNGRWAEASGAARAAISIDPLRESSQACLIRIHLARGNQSEALRAYDEYCKQLMTELGLEPTTRLSGLVDHIRQ